MGILFCVCLDIDLFTKAPDLNSYIYATPRQLCAVDFSQDFVNFKQFLMGSLPFKVFSSNRGTLWNFSYFEETARQAPESMKLGEEKCKKGKSSPGLNQYVWQMQYLRQVCDKYQKNHLLFHSNEKIAVLLQFACLMLTSGMKLGLQSKLSEPPNGRNHGQNCLASPPSQAGRIHF